MNINFEAILNAVASATNFARAIATVVDEAKENLQTSDSAALTSALERLKAENDRLYESVSAKLDAASQQE